MAEKKLFQFEGKKQAEEMPQRTTDKVQFSFELKGKDREQLFMRTPRSQAYLDIISSIDMLSSTDEEIIAKIKEVVDADIVDEYAQMTPEEMLEELRLIFEEEMAQRQIKLAEFNDKLYGVISKCFITGCYVHAINDQGTILEHYREHQKLPMALSRARDAYTKCSGNCITFRDYVLTVEKCIDIS